MERQLKKLQEDSYAVRREEGRPKHGQASFTILGVGAASWFFFAMAIILPKWRVNYMGMLGYPHARSWGLFVVVGMETYNHHEHMGNMCRYFSQMAPGGLCMTPICLWYRTKCMVSMNMCAVCYATAFFFTLVLILHTLCLVWTMRLTPRLIRWSATWWCAQVVLHLAVTMFYIFMSADCFASLDNESMYPEPGFSWCLWMEGLVILCVTTNAIMSMTLMKMWPESSSESSSGDSDDDDDDDDAGAAAMGASAAGYPPSGGYPQQGGYPPQGGYGGPQGYPPQQGYQQQGYPPQQGYGAPQGQWQG